MGRSGTVTVTTVASLWTLILDTPSMVSGEVPFTTNISGMLVDENNKGIPSALIRLFVNGIQFATAMTNANPFTGALGVFWHAYEIKAAGTYVFHAEQDGLRSIDQIVTAYPKPPVTELESGRYKAVIYSTRFKIDPDKVDEFKAQIKADWESREGVENVEDVIITDGNKGDVVEGGYVWYEEALGYPSTITQDYTKIEVIFHSASPVPMIIIVAALVFLIGILAGYLISGALQQLAEFIYKNPLLIAGGLGILILVLLFSMGFSAPKRRD